MSRSSRYGSGRGYQADEADPFHELNVTRSRIRSAYGRLNTPPKEQVLPEFRSVRRAQSANSTRGMSSSLSFSGKQQPVKQGDTHTMYERHYSGTFSARASLRPHSPTRRNNPHPTKGFMAWRVPDVGKQAEENDIVAETARQLHRDTKERFYQEYRGEGRPPAMQEDIVTRLANVPPPMPDTSSSVYGKHEASFFSVRRPSLPGISGGSRGESKQHQLPKSRHLTPSSGGGMQHARTKSESDADYVKASLRQRQRPAQQRSRHATEPVQHTLYTQPEIWHHRTMRDPEPVVIHRTSVFAAPKGARGEHFTIHPEWPDAH